MSDNSLSLKISTPYGVKFDNKIISATFKSCEGFITILKDHISIVGQLFECEMIITTIDNKQIKYNIGNGTFANINNSLKMITSYCSDSQKQTKSTKKDNVQLQLNKVNENGCSFTEMTLVKDQKED